MDKKLLLTQMGCIFYRCAHKLIDLVVSVHNFGVHMLREWLIVLSEAVQFSKER